MSTPTTDLHEQLVESWLIAAHGNFDRVRELYAEHPDLLNVRYAKFDETALEAAGHMGRPDIARFLLGEGAPMTVWAAAMLGETDQVAHFLAADPSLANARGVHGISLMYHAALSGKTAMTDLLVAHGGNAADDSTVHAAVRLGHLDMLRWLLARGASPTALNFSNKTPLQVAEAMEQPAMVAVLREYGATE